MTARRSREAKSGVLERPRRLKRRAMRPELRLSTGLKKGALPQGHSAVALRAIRIWLSVAPSGFG